MRQSHQVTEQEFVRFNKRREQEQGHEFSRKAIKDILKELNYPATDGFLQAMTSGPNTPIIRVSRGKYTFNPKPVFKDRLTTVWSDYSRFANSSRTNKPKEQEAFDINVIIKFLKARGYRILKPETKYVEL